MNSDQRFRIYCNNITKTLPPDLTVDDKTQPLILEGVASTSDIDLEGDFITPECIESFKNQATQCNIHNNHNVGLDDVIGTVLEVLDSDNQTLKIKFSILPLFRKHIEECIDNGVKLGLSIGGTILDYETGDEGLLIKDMMLHEISLTPLPANWNTMGTVMHTDDDEIIEAKCLNGVCKIFENKIIHKNIETEQQETMTEKRYYTKEEEAQFMSEDRVVELINEALNNFKDNAITEERVGEIIDAKLKEFVEQAKKLEAEEIAKAKKAEKDEEEEEKPEEEKEEEEEEEEDLKEKEGKKSKKAVPSIKQDECGNTGISPEALGELIAQALAMNKSQEPQVDIQKELQEFRKDMNKEIRRAMHSTKKDIEKSIFDGLMKENSPRAKTNDAQIKKFLKTKSEKEQKQSSTLNVKDIAKTLARDE